MQIIQELLDAGAKIEALDNEGNTPLLVAVQAGHPEAMETLGKKRANQSVTNYLGNVWDTMSKGIPTSSSIFKIDRNGEELMNS